MSFFLRHEWTEGATLPAAKLATCPQCGTLRTTNADGTIVFIRRTREPNERVKLEEPPCIAPKDLHR